MWVHLRPNSSKDPELDIFHIIKQCIHDPAYGLQDKDKKYLRDLETALSAFGLEFHKYEDTLFEKKKGYAQSGRDDKRLHALLFHLQTGFTTHTDSTKAVTEYLMQAFTHDIASQIVHDLHLTYVADILNVTDSDIDGLDLSAPLKRIFKRVRVETRDLLSSE